MFCSRRHCACKMIAKGENHSVTGFILAYAGPKLSIIQLNNGDNPLMYEEDTL